jgi:antitoxin MazE
MHFKFSFDIQARCDYNVLTSKGDIMRARIVKIGNSRGIRIPKPVLEQTGIQDDVEIELENNCIILRPIHRAREGWAQAFQRMADDGADELIIDEISDPWDENEWQW